MDLGRIRSPTQDLGVQAQRIRINRLLQLHCLVPSQGLQVGIARPGRERQEVERHVDILKAGVDHPLLQLVVDV